MYEFSSGQYKAFSEGQFSNTPSSEEIQRMKYLSILEEINNEIMNDANVMKDDVTNNQNSNTVKGAYRVKLADRKFTPTSPLVKRFALRGETKDSIVMSKEEESSDESLSVKKQSKDVIIRGSEKAIEHKKEVKNKFKLRKSFSQLPGKHENVEVKKVQDSIMEEPHENPLERTEEKMRKSNSKTNLKEDKVKLITSEQITTLDNFKKQELPEKLVKRVDRAIQSHKAKVAYIQREESDIREIRPVFPVFEEEPGQSFRIEVKEPSEAEDLFALLQQRKRSKRTKRSKNRKSRKQKRRKIRKSKEKSESPVEDSSEKRDTELGLPNVQQQTFDQSRSASNLSHKTSKRRKTVSMVL